MSQAAGRGQTDTHGRLQCPGCAPQPEGGMEILDDAVVYRNLYPAHRSLVASAACTARTRGPDGWQLLCAFRLGEAKMSLDGRLRVRSSADDGRTWVDEVAPAVADPLPPSVNEFGFQVGADSAGTTVLAAPRMRMVAPDDPAWSDETTGIVDADAAMLRRPAGGSWESAFVVEARRHAAEWAIPCGPPVALGGGRWIVPMERHAKHGDRDWLRRYDAFSARSDDDGRSWTAGPATLNDPAGRLAYYDQQLTLLPDGRLLSLAWVHDVVADQTLRARAGFSDDGGETWSAPFDTGIVGGPVTAISLADGRLLGVFNRRVAPSGIRAAMSDDGGRTWGRDGEFVLYDAARRVLIGETADRTSAPPEDADLWRTMWGWTFGNPVPVALPDDSVAVTFYAAGFDGVTGIRCARIRA